MMSAHNCQAPCVIVGSCESIKTGQCESCFRCRVEATYSSYPCRSVMLSASCSPSANSRTPRHSSRRLYSLTESTMAVSKKRRLPSIGTLYRRCIFSDSLRRQDQPATAGSDRLLRRVVVWNDVARVCVGYRRPAPTTTAWQCALELPRSLDVMRRRHHNFLHAPGRSRISWV